MVRHRQQKLDSLDEYCLRKGARGDDVGGETAGHRRGKCICVELREQKGPSSGVQGFKSRRAVVSAVCSDEPRI
ncbi:LOW QUALITY PROTEIN: hypothetical protein TorRG33x02_293200 [Trema orientale]|uniref:Uncharacterized protein n=1 Tax=Trema orientale TaxID=63057 RepID=A0A2P5C9I8_TREOI|nr:LOW QUALITY PROTEIN: hypothetical protein TorRG33x02_293200 [Trema orientale]